MTPVNFNLLNSLQSDQSSSAGGGAKEYSDLTQLLGGKTMDAVSRFEKVSGAAQVSDVNTQQQLAAQFGLSGGSVFTLA
jgi:hypothetical protein